MKITRVEFADFSPRYAGDGYMMSSGRDTQLFNRLVRLTADNGVSGIGEIVRPPIHALAEMEALEAAHSPALDGMQLGDLPACLNHWRSVGKLLQGFVFGVELAMLDLMGRCLGVPVSTLLGGAITQDVPEYLSLSCEHPDVMAGIVRRDGPPFTTIQAKLGSDDVGTDLERVRAVLAAMREDQRLLADFNGAMTPDEAIYALPDINDPRVMWEEPCKTYDEGVAVARAIDAPVMLDQCLTDLSTYARAIKDGAAAALVIKSDSIGGLTVGRTVRDIGAAAGITLRIDGWWSGQIAGAGALHLACGAPAETLIASIDLTDPLDTSRALVHKPAPGRVAPAPGAGLGPIPEDVVSLFG